MLSTALPVLSRGSNGAGGASRTGALRLPFFSYSWCSSSFSSSSSQSFASSSCSSSYSYPHPNAYSYPHPNSHSSYYYYDDDVDGEEVSGSCITEIYVRSCTESSEKETVRNSSTNRTSGIKNSPVLRQARPQSPKCGTPRYRTNHNRT